MNEEKNITVEQDIPTYNGGVIGAIVQLGLVNKGASDLETQKIVHNIYIAMTEKKRNKWHDKTLRKMVNEMDELSRKYFLEVITDMKVALDERFGKVVN